MEEEKKVRRTHRIGSITLGIVLLLFGCLFLAHILFPGLDYRMIFRLWPVIFIILGAETLIGAYRDGTGFVYDKGAIFIMIILAIFAMGMGVADWGMEEYSHYVHTYVTYLHP